MKIYNVTDPEFKAYGQIVEGMDDTVAAIVEALAKTTQPQGEVGYVPSDPILQDLPEQKIFADHCYGGMPTQMGWCNGFNRKLNCLEYHRDSEFNLGTEDFILLLGKQDQITDFMFDTADVKAFLVPKNTLIEVYATTLHYAPCHVEEKGFKGVVILPKGTNYDLTFKPNATKEDKLLTAVNKWLIAHEDAKIEGAFNGLKGVNVTL